MNDSELQSIVNCIITELEQLKQTVRELEENYERITKNE